VGEGSSTAAPHALDAERLVNVDSGWDYVTVRARPLPLPARDDKAESRGGARTADEVGVATRHRRSFPGSVTARGLVQLGRQHNQTVRGSTEPSMTTLGKLKP
jgi:hypothetical protein